MKKIGYTISAVAKIYEVHPQTLRAYERHGLLEPGRSQGNTRLFTDEDLHRLETILNLTRELGVNLAGVEVILNMREKMEHMQVEVESMLAYLKNHFDVDLKAFETKMQNALVLCPPHHPVRVRKQES